MTKDRVALIAGALIAVTAFPAAADARVKVLKRFTSCETLVGYATKHAPRVSPWYARGGGGIEDGAFPPSIPMPTAAPTPAKGGVPEDTSTTNNQEEGVDEPDTVKTDGRTLYVLNGSKLTTVDARASTPKVLGELTLDGSADQMLISGDRALVIGDAPTAYPGPLPTTSPRPRLSPGPGWYRPSARLTEVDISNPAAPTVVRTLDTDGYFVAGRLVGSTARIAIKTRAWALDAGDKEMQARTVGWVPTGLITNRRTKKAKRRALTSCDDVRRPRVFAGLDMVTVLTIDVEKGLPAIDSDAVMTDAGDVYASTKTLYLATHEWNPPTVDQPSGATTQLNAFDISNPDRTEYRATGNVAGYVLNQFAMSEQDGILRVATTRDTVEDDSESAVTTFERREDKLVKLGEVAGLGKGERIFGVRFLGDVGYVVTFRQTDPLYTIDLSEPRAPKVLGELKIPGYSAYLHPVGEGLLLGVGQDANEQGRRQGLLVQLFDVSDLSAPKRIDLEVIPGYSSSSVEWDHHAFLFWPKTGLAVVPYSDYTGNDGSAGAIGYRVANRKLSRIGVIDGRGDQYAETVDRAVVIGDRLFTTSGAGLLASDLDTLAPGPFLPFG